MSRITDIFIGVRDIVNDPDKERWSDDGFFRLLKEGLDDISKQTKMFNAYTAILLTTGTSSYRLPKDLIELLSVTYDGHNVELTPTSKMNRLFGHSWIHDTTTSNIKNIVFDRQYIHTLRVHPTPFFNSPIIDYQYDPVDFGLTGDIEPIDSLEDVFGIISQFSDNETADFTTDIYGIISDIVDGKVLLVSYIRTAKKPETIFDDFELPYIYDVALKHYIAGWIFRQDVDTQNRALGSEELELYVRELATIQDSTSKDSAIMDKHDVQYNGMG